MKKVLTILLFLLLTSCSSKVTYEENFWNQPISPVEPEVIIPLKPTIVVPEEYPKTPGRFPTYGTIKPPKGCIELRLRGGDC
jgi:hypothetical protein